MVGKRGAKAQRGTTRGRGKGRAISDNDNRKSEEIYEKVENLEALKDSFFQVNDSMFKNHYATYL